MKFWEHYTPKDNMWKFWVYLTALTLLVLYLMVQYAIS